MSERSATYSSAASLLDAFLSQWLRHQQDQVAGHEQEALVELVRSADLHAYFLNFFNKPELSDEFAIECNLNRAGIGPFLRVLLPKIERLGDGICWSPSTKANASWADCALANCGRLTLLRRLAHCERYGLVRCTVHSDQHISIHITDIDKDSLDRLDRLWLVKSSLRAQQTLQEDLNRKMMGWARDRIDKYVGIHESHFIQYESDFELLKLYQQQIECRLLTSAEADALPDDVKLGPYSFGEWKRVAVIGAARALLHLSFATRLAALNRDTLDLRNLLTIFVRHEDLRAVWSEQIPSAGGDELDEIADVFMLTAEHAEDYFANHDSPLPYNIRFGKYFALLPQFGYLSNTCTFLVTQLKRKYRKDWDNAVNQREAQFQQDLYRLFAANKYYRGRENVVIRKPNGTRETDIDAVLYEVASNSVYLIQLKWFDVVAHSLRERQSKITNLLKANKWVDQVSRWASSLRSCELLSNLGLEEISSTLPLKIRNIVLTRTAARFSGAHKFDERAAWISWPQLCRIITDNRDCEFPLEIAWQTAVDEVKVPRTSAEGPTKYCFPGLQIDVYDQHVT